MIGGNPKMEKNLQEQLQQKKEMIEKDHQKTNVKFQQSTGEKVEEEFKQYTVGLSTKEEFKRKHDNIRTLIQDRLDSELQAEELKKKRLILERKQKYKKQKNNLSFMDDDEEEEEDNEEEEEQDGKEENNGKEKITKKIILGKNPNVQTDFLPDQERDRIHLIKKEQFQQEYLDRKSKLENQFVDVQFSYWDGFKVIKNIRVRQKTQVLDMLEQCRKLLLPEYPHLAKEKAINLIAVARDHILQSKLSFFEIIETNMKNKRGQQIFDWKEKKEKDPLGKEIVVSEDNQTVIMIIEKKVTEKVGENPLYFFLKDQE